MPKDAVVKRITQSLQRLDMEDYMADVKLVSTQVENRLSDPVITNIRDEWDWIRPALVELKEQIPSLTWRPEDVYAECLYGKAVLHVSPEGFVITKVITDQYTKDRTLLFGLLGLCLLYTSPSPRDS